VQDDCDKAVPTLVFPAPLKSVQPFPGVPAVVSYVLGEIIAGPVYRFSKKQINRLTINTCIAINSM
jgi:hypothetical protein